MNYIFEMQTFLLLLIVIPQCLAIQCFQCSSSDEEKGVDKCGAYTKFDKEEHVAVDCNSDEAVTPGTFCMKVVQQGPRGFIWDGRWRQVIRRCSSVADTGVTGVCNWGVRENGIYWEECYCSEDDCNHASITSSSFFLYLACAGLVAYFSGR